jgi:hypothetical protein
VIISTPKIKKLYRTVFILSSKNDSENLCFEYDHYHQCRLLDVLETIGPSNKYIFRVGVGDILILLTV